MSASHESDDDG
jgi:hypothetical protein